MGMKYRKYSVQKSALILGSVLSFVFLGIFILCLFLRSNESDDSVSNIYFIIQEISIVSFTIFGGSVLSALFIDRRNKNTEYISQTINEVVKDPLFLKSLDQTTTTNILDAIYGENSQRKNAVNEFVERLKNEEYYMDNCSLDINCKVENGYFKKTIVKKLVVRSFKKNHKEKIYKLISVIGKNNYESDKFLKINYVKLNGKDITKKIVKNFEKVQQDQYIYLHNNYKYRCIYFIKNLNLHSDKETSIELEYESITDLDDLKYVTRITGPCKAFSIKYVCENDENNNYEVSGTAFGFMDNGCKTTNIVKNIFSVEFQHWTYKDDGVVIVMKKIK